MKEVERRFLVKNVDNIDLSKFEKKEIQQYYLYRDKIVTVRKRKVTLDNGDTLYFHTVKYRPVFVCCRLVARCQHSAEQHGR